MIKTLFKKSFITTTLFLISTSVFGQIRSYVGIVRQQYFPEHIKYFENYRDELEKNGYSTYAKYVDAYLKGGFGSGFVYVASDGTNYIITNRHVVSQAASASVEFENADTGELKKYENLSVLLTNDEIDIAILGFQNGEKPFKRGLTISSANVSDGQEVWSAGFPGLGKEPVWQLGKGTVTNSKARIKELLDPKISTIIQHSAQVDGGNSGGPLMTVSSKGTAGYEVIGINTWKASHRDSTNFSIPSSVILKMISDVQKKADSSSDTKALEERTRKLAENLKDLSNDFTSVAKYISYERASTQGQKDFESAIHFAPSTVRSTILEAFSFDPAEGLRYASAYQLWKEFSAESNSGINYTVGEAKISDGKNTVDFTGNGENTSPVTTTWIKEHGLWRLSELSSDSKTDRESKKTKSSKGTEISGYDRIVLSAGADFSINGKDIAFRLSGDFFTKTEILGFSVMYHNETIDCFGEDIGFNTLGIGVNLRLPLKTGSFGLNPYGKFLGNFASGDSRVFIGYMAEIGIQAMFNTNGNVHFGVGAGVNQIYLTPWMDMDLSRDSDTEPDSFTNRGISIYGIISF